jgi:hypothetical protein
LPFTASQKAPTQNREDPDYGKSYKYLEFWIQIFQNCIIQ